MIAKKQAPKKMLRREEKNKIQRRYQFAKASLCIEGLDLTQEEKDLFESLLRENSSLEEMRKALTERFQQP